MNQQELEDRFIGVAELRGLQILHGAFGAGVLLFGLVVGLLSAMGLSSQQEPAASDPRMLVILSLVHAAMVLTAWPLGWGLYSWRFAQATKAESPADFSAHLRGGAILRLALLEGPAIFGLVICLLGVVSGELKERPHFWWNAASAARERG